MHSAKPVLSVLVLTSLVTTLLPAQTTTPSDPARLLVVYNDSWPDRNGNGVGDSKELALAYAKARHVPAANLLGLQISGTSRIIGGSGTKAWGALHDLIVTPLKARLAKLGKTKIDGFLLCYGVPYRINSLSSNKSLRAIDHLIQVPDGLGTKTTWGFNGWWTTNPYFESSPGVGTDKGRFQHSLYKYAGKDYYLVTRLDGFDLEASRDLLDAALYAEKYGSKGQGKMDGNAYIDTRYGKKTDSWLKSNYPNYPGYSTYGLWDMRMAYGKLWPEAMKIPTYWEPSGKEIGETGAKYTNGKPALLAPEALLYFGWYNYNQYHDVWSWLTGSVACDLNSNSIAGFDSRTATRKGFLTKAMERGLAAGAGVIAEPYLSGHERPEILLYYLLKGYTFAECSALGDPALWWRGVRMGDPLYAPYRAGLKRNVDTSKPVARWTRVTARTGTSATLDLALVRSLTSPELGRATVAYGTTAAMNQKLDPKKGHHARQLVPIDKLDPKAAGYYTQVTWTDPAGNRTTLPPFAMTPRAFTKIDVHVSGPASIQQNAILPLRFSLASTPHLWNLKTFAIEIRQTLPTKGPWVDITALALGIASEVAFGPEAESLLFQMKVPFPLKGSFEFRIRATNSLGSDSQVLPLTAK